jgi:hypothetical protein
MFDRDFAPTSFQVTILSVILICGPPPAEPTRRVQLLSHRLTSLCNLGIR